MCGGTVRTTGPDPAQPCPRDKVNRISNAPRRPGRRAGISQPTDFDRKKTYGGLLPDEMRQLKALENENARLKKIVADLTLRREMLRT